MRNYLIETKGLVFVLILALVIFLHSPALAEPLIVDHTAVQQFDQIPDYWLEQAKQLTVHFGHTSHGSQILTGLQYLEDYVDSVKYNRAVGGRTGDRTPNLPAEEDPPALRMWEEGLWPYTDAERGCLGYWDGQEAQDGTIAVLNSGLFDISGWFWCGQVSTSEDDYIQEYLDVMTMYEEMFPDVIFFYTTGHNVEWGPRPYQQNQYNALHRQNDMIRQHVIDTDGVLYDFADIEAWDLDGVYRVGEYEDSEDSTGVWCQEWLDNNPGTYPNLPGHDSSGGCGTICPNCAHSHSLNCVIKGKAFWWMMARLAGWEGVLSYTYGDISGNGDISASDASMAARYAVVLINLEPEQITAADVTGNGSVSATDASWIARKAVDETIVFPVEE